MTASTFAEIYCAHHKVPPVDFEITVLLRTLPPHARLLAPLCQLFNRNHFVADIDLIRAVGRLHRLRYFSDEVADFKHHPANCGFWHNQMRVRVSTKRLRQLLKATLPRGEEGSHPPMAAAKVPKAA
jgi:hypothetical protein